jgi:putative ABC transport system permease protein
MLQDLRYALRLLMRSPGFALTSIATLALGIAVTSAIFSVVDGVLFRPIPFPDAERLVMVWETDRDTRTSHEPGAWPDFIDFQQRSVRVDTFAGLIAGEATLTPERGEPVRLAGLIVTRDFLPLMGVTPLIGRTFTADDERLGGPLVVLISEALWERTFQRDPNVLGRTIRLDERPHSIVGVVAAGADFGVTQVLRTADYSRGFVDRDPRSAVDVWVPLQPNPKQLVRDTHPLLMIGRLAPGATVASAQEELAAIAADLERTYESNKARGVYLEPLNGVIFGQTRTPLLVLLAAVGVVLLIACANVANLLLARNASRRREVAVRTAIGADLSRLGRQFVVENLVLSVVATVLGVALAFALQRLLIALAPPEVPRLALVGMNVRVFSLAVAISAMVAFVFGAIPLAQSRRKDLRSALDAGEARGATSGPASRLTRAALVVSEVALAVVLVVGAGLLIKSFWRLQQVDPGFDPSGVLKAEFQLPSARYVSAGDRWPNIVGVHRFHATLLERSLAIPGVEHAAIAASHPLNPGFTNSFVIVGREQESQDLPEMSMRHVTPGYFSALRVRLIRGRFLEERDGTQAAPVLVLNETAARRLFADRDPIGQQLRFWGVSWTIVGVVGDEKVHGLGKMTPIAAYTPIAQAPPRGGAVLLVRGSGDPIHLASAVRAAVASIDPALAVFGVEPLSRTVSGSMGTERFLTLLLVLFAGLSLLLAAVGIYGVLNYAVTERTRELGIRLALGASPRSMTQLVVGQGARLTALGLSIGLIFAVLFSRALSGLLFGVTATDSSTFAIVVVVLGLVGLMATWLPVRRAAKVDPLVLFHGNG